MAGDRELSPMTPPSGEPSSAKPSPAEHANPSSPRRGFPIYRVLVSGVLVVAVILGVFPLVFGPSIDTPYTILPANPLPLNVRISNQNFTPLNRIEYTCEPVKVVLASGVEAKDISVVSRGIIRRIGGRGAVAARCETAYVIDAPLKSAEYRFTLKYRPFPWTQERSIEAHIVATIDAQGHVTGWTQR
jgi:hypothetical protein